MFPFTSDCPADLTLLTNMNPPIHLPASAEAIRFKIKSMIPDLSTEHTEDTENAENAENHAVLLKKEENGNKTYGGSLLMEQVSLIAGQLPIPDPEVYIWSSLYIYTRLMHE